MIPDTLLLLLQIRPLLPPPLLLQLILLLRLLLPQQLLLLLRLLLLLLLLLLVLLLILLLSTTYQHYHYHYRQLLLPLCHPATYHLPLPSSPARTVAIAVLVGTLMVLAIVKKRYSKSVSSSTLAETVYDCGGIYQKLCMPLL